MRRVLDSRVAPRSCSCEVPMSRNSIEAFWPSIATACIMPGSGMLSANEAMRQRFQARGLSYDEVRSSLKRWYAALAAAVPRCPRSCCRTCQRWGARQRWASRAKYGARAGWPAAERRLPQVTRWLPASGGAHSLAAIVAHRTAVLRKSPSGTSDMSTSAKQITSSEPLRKILSDPRVPKVGYDLKRQVVALSRLGVELAGLQFDPLIAGHLLDAGQRNQGLSDLLDRFADGDSSGGNVQNVPQTAEQAASSCHGIASLNERLSEEIQTGGFGSLFSDVEKLIENQEQNVTNKVNIEFNKQLLEKALEDIEKLKDKVRENGNG